VMVFAKERGAELRGAQAAGLSAGGWLGRPFFAAGEPRGLAPSRLNALTAS
jgi:hypothetical protein